MYQVSMRQALLEKVKFSVNMRIRGEMQKPVLKRMQTSSGESPTPLPRSDRKVSAQSKRVQDPLSKREKKRLKHAVAIETV